MTKPDPLTPEERAAVEARIKAGAVTKLPAGTSSFIYPVWDGSHLVMPESATNGFRASMNRFHGKDGKPRKRHKIAPQPLPAHVVERREKVRALHAQGLTVPEMLEHVPGVAAHSLRNDLARLELQPHINTGARCVDPEARAAEIRALAAEGLTSKEAAERIGLHVRNLRKAARDIGVSFAKRVDFEARADKMRAMAKEGLTTGEAAAQLGLHVDTVRKLAAEVGLRFVPGPAAPRPAVPPDPMLSAVIGVVADVFDVTVAALCSPSRKADLARARFAACFLLMARGTSLRAAGDVIGGRHYATVRSAVQQAEALCASDPAFARALDQCRAVIAGMDAPQAQGRAA